MQKTQLGLLALILFTGACGGEPDALGTTEQGPEPELGSQSQPLTGSDDATLLPPELVTLSTWASNLSTVYGGVNTGISVLQLVGFLPTPPSQQQLFDQLDADLTRIGVSVANKIDAASRAYYIPLALAASDQARLLAAEGRQVDVASVTYANSDQAARSAVISTVFQRVYDTSTQRLPGATGIPLNTSGAPAQKGDLVYDWRLGVPDLMQLIALRLEVLSVADPDWMTTHLEVHRDELTTYYDALVSHYTKMTQGVHCTVGDDCHGGNTSWGVGHIGGSVVTCADIYTGVYKQYVDNSCPVVENLWSVRNRLQQQIWAEMPLFQLRRMIDAFALYLHPEADLTQLFGDIPLTDFRTAPARTPTPFCADVENGDSTSGTPVWLYWCDGNMAQWWSYDRSHASIQNVPMGKCLSATGATASAPLGVPVRIADCNGSVEQQWSYDTLGQTLYSAVNPYVVLASQGQDAMSPLMTASATTNLEFGGGDQIWLAEQEQDIPWWW